MQETKITTIKLERETKSRLEKLRENKRETYDEIMRKILWVLNMLKSEPEKAREALNKIDENKKKNIELRKQNGSKKQRQSL